ncbi:uncharacterized protein YecT (DUF1311 family) [Sphingomonas sp. UYAg733]
MLLTALLLAAATPNCADPQTQADMTQCAGRAAQRADAEMTRQWNATYAFMKRRDAQDISRGGGFGYAPALLASQRAWLKFRDTQCVIEGGQFAGGSMQPMAQAQCKAGLAKARTAQLRGLVWKS